MALLLVFAFLAGAATAITPCVLPVLPALLSAGGSGGKRRPFGVITGLTITHTITIVGIASAADSVGASDGATRTIAIAFLLVFGAALLIPAVGHWIEARLAFLSRYGPKQAGDGFWSGIPVGAALGFVYAPCAGPVLGAVISVSVTEGASTNSIALGAAYGLGSGLVLLVLTLGGRRLMDRVRTAGRGPRIQRVLGGILVVTAVLMFARLDVKGQNALADHFPAFLTNPTKAIEDSNAVKDRLEAHVTGRAKFDSDRPPETAANANRPQSQLPILGPAPDFRDNQEWFNSKPLTLAGLRGRVVLIDFWTYTCINCIRTLPYLRSWDERYRKDGLTIVGVHSPEFAFEKKASNVRASIKQNDLKYPVAQDNDFGTWQAWGNNAWPAKYLIDANGQVRYTHIGEGDYEETEEAIRSLLEEARGNADLGPDARQRGEILTPGTEATPETYLGTKRAPLQKQAWGEAGPPTNGTKTYRAAAPDKIKQSTFALGGRWSVDGESSTAAGGAILRARVVGKAVYLVLSSKGGTPRTLRVRLDGKLITAKAAGDDVRDGRVRVTNQRLYRLVNLPSTQEHVLELGFERGISAFAFTFG